MIFKQTTLFSQKQKTLSLHKTGFVYLFFIYA